LQRFRSTARRLELAKPLVKKNEAWPTLSPRGNWMLGDHVEEWYTMGAEGFRLHVRSKFGSTACGWRFGLDKEMTGRLSHREFCIACRSIGYHGKIKSVLQEIAPGVPGAPAPVGSGSGRKCKSPVEAKSVDFVTFFEVDHEAAVMIAKFRELVMTRCGGMRDAWMTFAHAGATQESFLRNGKVYDQNFISFAKSVGAEDGKELFRLLRQNPSRHYLTFEDVDVWKIVDAATLSS